jgi:uncharacterized protein YqhQ
MNPMRNNAATSQEPLAIGGQAVIEGVMMRAPGMIATAVRRASGEIAVWRTPFRSLGERFRILKLPILRGAIGLVEMMVIGIRTLNYSAEVSLSDDLAKSGSSAPGENGSGGKPASLKLGLAVAFSIIVGIVVFFVTPLAVTSALFDVDQEPLPFNLTAGLVRVGLLLGYLGAISFSSDMRRLFQYHGAEHKAVFAFEKREQLTVDAADRQSRFHPRCGTSFLLIVMLSAILLFSIFDLFVLQWVGTLTLPVRLITHLPLIPLVGGISYEFIRASAKRTDTAFGRAIVAPGLWLQRLTTKEPTADQLEVALTALRSALGKSEEVAQPGVTGRTVEVSLN